MEVLILKQKHLSTLETDINNFISKCKRKNMEITDIQYATRKEEYTAMITFRKNKSA